MSDGGALNSNLNYLGFVETPKIHLVLLFCNRSIKVVGGSFSLVREHSSLVVLLLLTSGMISAAATSTLILTSSAQFFGNGW